MNLQDIARIAIPGAIATGLALLLTCSGCGDDATSPDPTGHEISELPADTGGVHLALPHDPDGADAAPFGCYVYLPSGLDQSSVAYPLLVFLHGAGERGDSALDPGTLDLVLRNGPPRLIERDEWAPPHPMIVVSPQCHSGWWNAADVRSLLVWIDKHYPVDRSHIYLTGLSMGGYGTWNYLGRYGNAAGDSLPVAAAAPICGAGNTSQAEAMMQTPIWAFHGTADGTVAPSGSVSMIEALGALTPAVPPRLTLYDGVGHDSWSRTYNGDGIGQGLDTYADAPDVDPWLVPYDVDLYTWFFTHQR
jgi:hypothetical protein